MFYDDVKIGKMLLAIDCTLTFCGLFVGFRISGRMQFALTFFYILHFAVLHFAVYYGPSRDLGLRGRIAIRPYWLPYNAAHGHAHHVTRSFAAWPFRLDSFVVHCYYPLSKKGLWSVINELPP